MPQNEFKVPKCNKSRPHLMNGTEFSTERSWDVSFHSCINTEPCLSLKIKLQRKLVYHFGIYFAGNTKDTAIPSNPNIQSSQEPRLIGNIFFGIICSSIVVIIALLILSAERPLVRESFF